MQEPTGIYPLVKTPKNRRLMRAMGNRGSAEKCHSRHSGKTGQPAWFAAMKFQAAEKKILGKIPVSQLARFGVITFEQEGLLIQAGIKTVWEVSSTSKERIGSVLGLDSDELEAMGYRAFEKVNVGFRWFLDTVEVKG